MCLVRLQFSRSHRRRLPRHHLQRRAAPAARPITKYQYQLTTNGPWVDAPSLSSPILVGGLTNGTAYDVSVRAVNAIGAGAASAPQAATPATVPGAPTIVGDTVAGSNSQLSAAFTAPASNGGAAITSYQYSTDAGATWRTRDAGTTASPLVISTLSSDGTTPLEQRHARTTWSCAR